MNKYYTRADEYRKYMPSPYFARMDFDVSDGNEESVYIGKEGFRLDGQEAVIDWRSPVGQCFYMKTQREFHIGKYTYTQFLRRALDVQQAKLISCVTEFDGNDVTLDGEVIDPFLLTVLKDKRRQHRLTDIIRTIQENQNSIIRRPKEESFIVQGCAGSGKTMILLHRLSYLKFNHREMSFASTRIITPNPFFDAHINELSHELGLDEIKRFSVEEY